MHENDYAADFESEDGATVERQRIDRFESQQRRKKVARSLVIGRSCGNHTRTRDGRNRKRNYTQSVAESEEPPQS